MIILTIIDLILPTDEYTNIRCMLVQKIIMQFYNIMLKIIRIFKTRCYSFDEK